MKTIMVCLALVSAISIGIAPTIIGKIAAFGVFAVTLGILLLIDHIENK